MMTVFIKQLSSTGHIKTPTHFIIADNTIAYAQLFSNTASKSLKVKRLICIISITDVLFSVLSSFYKVFLCSLLPSTDNLLIV